MPSSEPEYWTPHPSSAPILLPSIPHETSSASSSKLQVKLPTSSINRWLNRHSLNVVEVDPEILHAYEKRWEFKWENYSRIVGGEIDRKLAAWNAEAAVERAKWLAADFERLKDRFIHLDTGEPELTTGRKLCLSLIENTRLDLDYVTNQQLPLAKESLKKVELVNQFVTQSITQIVEKHNLSRVKAKIRTENSKIASSLVPDIEGVPLDQVSRSSPAPSPEQTPDKRSYPLSTVPIQDTPSVSFPHPTPLDSLPRGIALPFEFPSSNDGIPLPVTQMPAQAQMNVNNPFGARSYSTVSSHRVTLGALLTIGFFGASITWSTLFSGTRGNLALIAWSACLFIVATACAAAASLLAVSEEAIVDKYPPVRWVVRILSRISSLHIFGGLLLLGVAVLVLDPGVEDVSPGPRGSMRAAGGYALVMSSAPMVIAVFVWRRYTQRRWFN